MADLERGARFYQEVMGFVPRQAARREAIQLGHGAGHHVLELREGSGVHHFGIEVRGAELRRFGDGLVERGLSPRVEDDSLWLTDPDGNVVQLHGPVDRIGERSTIGATRPQRADHITFGSQQVQAMVHFYADGLGLRISDQMEYDFVWLRGNRHHHDVAVVRAASASLDHYSYEVGSWANLGVWCDRLADAGIPLSWGPGRHGPGHNLFAFVADPDGYQIELSCEMEQFRDELVDYGQRPRTWRRSPTVANLWGPLPAARSALTGQVEHGGGES